MRLQINVELDYELARVCDLLMQIDPEHYRIAVKQAQSLVASRKATWEMRKVNAHRRADLDALVISKENRDDASNIADSALADYQHAQAQLEAAQLNLKRTKVLAAVDGYVTNLNVHRGDYARIGEPKMAVVDMNSFWVYGFFEETKLPHVRVGDQAEESATQHLEAGAAAARAAASLSPRHTSTMRSLTKKLRWSKNCWPKSTNSLAPSSSSSTKLPISRPVRVMRTWALVMIPATMKSRCLDFASLSTPDEA